MNGAKSSTNQESSLTRDLLHVARYYIGGRRGLVVLAAVAIVAGLALNWGWLVAAGIAPLLLGVLPCVAMCALGLCMHRIGSRSCSTDSVSRQTATLPHHEALAAEPERSAIGQPEGARDGDGISLSAEQRHSEERRKTHA